MSLQRGSTTLESRAADSGRVQAATIINQQPGVGHFLSQQWTEECQQVRKGAAAMGLLAAGLGVGYYFGLYLPGRDHACSAAVAECVTAANENADKEWESSCKDQKLGKHCKMNFLIAASLNEGRRQSVGDCYRPIP